MAKRKKTKLSIYCEFILAMPFIFTARHIPFFLIQPLSMFFGRVFYLCSAKHRRYTLSHLKHAGITTTDRETKKMAKAVFTNMSRLGLELFKLPHIITPETLDKYMTFSGSEESLSRFIHEGSEQAIIVTAHYGNWELLGQNFKEIFGRKVTAIMRVFDNPLIGKQLYKVRNNGESSEMVPKEGALRSLLRALKKSGDVCILADQHAGGGVGIETTFFGHPCKTHASPAMLHLKSGIPILVFAVKRVDNKGNFELICKDPIEYTPTGNKDADIVAVTQKVTDYLEDLIRQCPEQWMWSHRRWLDINRKGSAQYQKEN